jgi:6,7-dimethyl-8-ribityllumazine synthase
MNRTDEPDEGTWGRETADDLERATENVLEGWPDAEPEEPEERSADDADPDASVATAIDEHDDEGAAPPEDELWRSEAELASATSVVAEPDADVASAAVETSAEHAPGDLAVPPGYAVLEGRARGGRRAVGIVVSRFNGEVTGALLASALDELGAHDVGPDSITIMPVPGAFELPIAAMALAKTRRFACVVALGCVIRGDTPHFDYVASEAASGLQLAAIETGVPVAFGVLTLDRQDQAEPRFDKGAEAVRTALEMADLFANLRAAAAR